MTLKRQALHVALFALATSFAASAALAQPWRELPPPAAAATTAPAPVEAVPAAAKPAAPASSAPRSYLRQQASSKKPVASAPTTSPLRVALMAGLVAGLGVWALLKKRRRSTVARATRSDLEIVSAARVGNKAQVVVVNVGGRKVLLGVTESEVSRLAWLDGELEGDGASTEPFEEPAPFVAQPARKPAFSGALENKPAHTESQPRRFRDALLGALGQTQNQKPAVATSDDAAVAIAESMQDVVTRSPRVAVPAEAPSTMVDVEGQAKGLVLRLQKRA
jgi:flagellar protein FliO/FliZ